MKKKNVNNYYEMRIHDSARGTGYYSYNVQGAIREFLNDPLYNFKDGIYVIEVRGYEKHFVVEKKTTIITKTSYKITKKK